MVVPPVAAALAVRLKLPVPETGPLKVCEVPVLLKEARAVEPKVPLAMTMGRGKLKPLPEKRGWKRPVPEAASLRKVKVPPLPLMLPLLKLRSTVAAVLEVVMALSAVDASRLGDWPTGGCATRRGRSRSSATG